MPWDPAIEDPSSATTKVESNSVHRRFPGALRKDERASNSSAPSSANHDAQMDTKSQKIVMNEKLKRGETLSSQLIIEVTRDKELVYRRVEGGSGGEASTSGRFHVTEKQLRQRDPLELFAQRYLLPEGFPDSVEPQYARYMGWRGVQYFFGGAMSVFTTKSLISAIGFAGKHSGEAAAAINWVLKDGAGRLGRLLFARWGRELDCELKQFRLLGDFLMETGASLELATIAAPNLFLPLACTANLAKNLAAVAASSTRAPIYRSFAKSNNLADITAKGESVANLADLMGTAFGIALSKLSLPIVPTFMALSAGYLFASRKEVDSVELPYLNRARLAYTARKFLETGYVPTVEEGNAKEPLLPFGPYSVQGRILLGSAVHDACDSPSDLYTALERNRPQDPYVITYRPCSGHAHILLKEGVRSDEILKAAFLSHVMLYKLDTQDKEKDIFRIRGGVLPNGQVVVRLPREGRAPGIGPQSSADGTREDFERALQSSIAEGEQLYREFLTQARQRGWKIEGTLLNPKENRIRTVPLPGI